MGGFRWVSLRVPMDGSVVVDLAVTVGGWVGVWNTTAWG